jgi:hypothetical protein
MFPAMFRVSFGTEIVPPKHLCCRQLGLERALLLNAFSYREIERGLRASKTWLHHGSFRSDEKSLANGARFWLNFNGVYFWIDFGGVLVARFLELR